MGASPFDAVGLYHSMNRSDNKCEKILMIIFSIITLSQVNDVEKRTGAI